MYDLSAASVIFIFTKISFMISYQNFTTATVEAINLLRGTKRSFEGNITSVCGVNLWKRRQRTIPKCCNSRTEPHGITNPRRQDSGLRSNFEHYWRTCFPFTCDTTFRKICQKWRQDLRYCLQFEQSSNKSDIQTI